jgi:hypothetical protein
MAGSVPDHRTDGVPAKYPESLCPMGETALACEMFRWRTMALSTLTPSLVEPDRILHFLKDVLQLVEITLSCDED